MMKLSAAKKRAQRQGIDTTLIEANLSRTPTERALALQDALSFMERLRAAGEKRHAKPRKNHDVADGR